MELNRIINVIESLDPSATQMPIYNLTLSEQKALKEMKAMCSTDIEIKKADKGSAFVILDKDYYRDKLVLNDHLYSTTYEETDMKSDVKVMQELRHLLKRHESCLTKKEFQYISDFEWKSSNFYVLPKIHKCKEIIQAVESNESLYIEMEPPSDLKGRAIVGGPQSPTQHLSELLEKTLSPLVNHLKSYIKDDWDFLRKFPHDLDPLCQLYSCDVVNLYTNITHELGITALKYWTNKLRHLIPERFSTEFIINTATFVLQNNNFCFDQKMYAQKIGTAIGTKFAPPYACLSMGYLEETKLYPELYLHFDVSIVEFIIELYKRYMDDGIVPLPPTVDINVFESILQGLDPSIEFTLEKAMESTLPNGRICKILNFLDVNVILHEDGQVETDVYYKATNSHDYLDFDSHHPTHIKENIPFNLAKRIIVFCSNERKEKVRLNELKQWLLKCNYPEKLIDKKFHCAKLQGPANKAKAKDSVIPLVSPYYNNYSMRNVCQTANSLLKSVKSDHLRAVFEDCQIIHANSQPPNLLLQLTNSAFHSSPEPIIMKAPGLFRCKGSRCDLCKFGYIQECTSFTTANGTVWTIKSHINCNSINVIYYLKCNSCNTSYTGKTNNLRLRMNNHKSSSMNGTGTNIFDNHVYECRQKTKANHQPLFLIYAFMTVGCNKLLLQYESYLHSKGHDNMN